MAEDNGRWYPGKYAKSLRNRRSSAKESSSSSSGWEDGSPGESSPTRESASSAGRADVSTGSVAAGSGVVFTIGGEISNSIRPSAAASGGTLLLKIFGLKHMILKNITVRVDLDAQFWQFDVTDEKATLSHEFEITNVTADVVIKISGTHLVTGAPASGYVVMPIVSFLTLSGAELPKGEWREIYPAYSAFKVQHGGPHDSNSNHQQAVGAMTAAATATTTTTVATHKFHSGFADLPGYALPRSVHSMGFLHSSVTMSFKPAIAGKKKTVMPAMYGWPSPDFSSIKIIDFLQSQSEFCGMLVPFPAPEMRRLLIADGSPRAIQLTHTQQQQQQQQQEALNALLVDRDLQRLRAHLLRNPAAVAPLLKIPNFLVLVAIWSFLCYSSSPTQLPLLLFLGVLFNGILGAMKREFGDVIIWNDPSQQTSGKIPSSSSSSQAPTQPPTIPETLSPSPAATAAVSTGDRAATQRSTSPGPGTPTPDTTSSTTTTAVAATTTTPTTNINALTPVRSGVQEDTLPSPSAALSSSAPSASSTTTTTITTTAAAGPAPIGRMTAVSASVSKYFEGQRDVLRSLVLSLEKIHSLLSFGDARISVAFYMHLFFFALGSQVFIFFLSAQAYLMVLGSAAITLLATKGFLLEVVATELALEKTPPSFVTAIYLSLYHRWARIPDTDELTHRYICSKAVVANDGPEMEDASNALAALRAAAKSSSK